MVLHGFPGGPSPGRHWRWWGRSKKCAKGWGACLRRGRPSSSSGAGGQSGNGARTRIDIWASVLPFKPSGQHRPSGPFEEAQRPGGGSQPAWGLWLLTLRIFPGTRRSVVVPTSMAARGRVLRAFGIRASWILVERQEGKSGKILKRPGGTCLVTPKRWAGWGRALLGPRRVATAA